MGIIRSPRSNEPITEDTPLTVAEQHFLANYIRLGNLTEAVIATPELQANIEGRSRNAISQTGQRILDKPQVHAEFLRAMNEAREATMATATEVMEYFTSVMRGEVKDQFGLDAPLAERTKAAQELAKRTVDIENRKQGNADTQIEIKLDWTR